MKKLFSLFLLFAINILLANNLQFIREDISFEIVNNKQNETCFIVDGLYYFENIGTEKISTTLFYPFPQDSCYAPVKEVWIENISKQINKIEYQKKESGITFKIKVDSNSSAIYHIKYKQKIFSGKVEYILTTTQNWQKALVEANYTLHFPKYLILESFSYSPDILEDKKDKFLFTWHKKKFMPQDNFIVKFRKNMVK